VFVDWFNDKCINMWSQGLNDLFEMLPFDGIWIDMNEPWGFQHGEMNPNRYLENSFEESTLIERRSRRKIFSI
jgi:alpha-glucosidase (family GH31 glycosyl hydrolase)